VFLLLEQEDLKIIRKKLKGSCKRK